MQNQPEFSTSDRRDQDAMFNDFLKRGAMTKKELLAAGYSEESIDRNSPIVAERIRSADMAA